MESLLKHNLKQPLSNQQLSAFTKCVGRLLLQGHGYNPCMTIPPATITAISNKVVPLKLI
jgi:hypothetical protein